MATKQRLLKAAQWAVAQRMVGDRGRMLCAKLDGKPIVPTEVVLTPGARCAEFVRNGVETAIGLGEGHCQFASATARADEASIKRLIARGEAGYRRVSYPAPGDVVCCNDQSYAAGHIAIYGGTQDTPDGRMEVIYENTSSDSRGWPRDPGTKMSPFSSVEDEISGFYQVFPSAVPVGYEPGNCVVSFENRVDNMPGWFSDHAVISAHNLGELIGTVAVDHMRSHRAVTMGVVDPARLPAPLAAYPDYKPGPMMFVTPAGQCHAWFTGDHAIVGVAAAAKLLGYEARDEMLAGRRIVLVPRTDVLHMTVNGRMEGG